MCGYSIFWAKRLNANEIHSEMRPVYGDKCFTRPAIHVWCTKFARGTESIVDIERPGRHVVATTNATIAAIDTFIRSDRRVSISDIVRHTGISRDSVHRIIRKSSQVSEGVCSIGAKTAKVGTAGHTNDDIS